MPSRRYTIVVADRTTGVVRRITISARPVIAAVCAVASLPVLIGVGSAWKARGDVAALYISHQALQDENASYRSATESLVGEIDSLQTAIKDLGSVCAGASADITYTVSGIVAYNADKMYASSLSVTAAVREHYPNGCAPFGLTCDQLAQSGMQAIDAGAIVSYSCATDAAGACNCGSVTSPTTTNASGTYSTSGGTLTTTHDGMTSMSAYCVQGGLLHEIAGPGDGGVTSMGDIVLTKQ